MLGFHADYEIAFQDGEIAEARWFHFRDLPSATAISRWLIDAFVQERSAVQEAGR